MLRSLHLAELHMVHIKLTNYSHYHSDIAFCFTKLKTNGKKISTVVWFFYVWQCL